MFLYIPLICAIFAYPPHPNVIMSDTVAFRHFDNGDGASSPTPQVSSAHVVLAAQRASTSFASIAMAP